LSTQLVLPELIEAAVRAGRPEVAREALERLSAMTAIEDSDWAKGLEARSRALLSEGHDAERYYAEAVERLGRTRLRPELARAHLLYGEWLRRELRRGDARHELRAAYDLFTAIGAEAFAERARRELLATGETVRKRQVDAHTELTPQERHIARLARDGRTNSEIAAELFISARTVEWHLRKVFTKLGITSRMGLHDALPMRSTSAPSGSGPALSGVHAYDIDQLTADIAGLLHERGAGRSSPTTGYSPGGKGSRDRCGWDLPRWQAGPRQSGAWS
jgi:DNA-binding CsgD family transcriptional regulator